MYSIRIVLIYKYNTYTIHLIIGLPMTTMVRTATVQYMVKTEAVELNIHILTTVQ